MLDFLKELLRKNALKKCPKHDATSLLPISEIHSAVVVLNVEDTDFNVCKEDIMAFFRHHNIKAEIFFFDFRKLEKNELLLTSIQNTVLRKDLNWFGMPNQEKMNLLTAKQCDLYISMVDDSEFANIYAAKSVDARMKIGRHEFGDGTFDMIVTGNGTVRSIFKTMQEYLLKIN